MAPTESTTRPPVVDSHVHLFPPRVFAALWRWFDAHAWTIRYRLQTEEVIAFLLDHGVDRVVALHYSHIPDMARTLNHYVADIARARPEVIPLGTVLPGEPDADAIVKEALGPLGLRGIKIHCHVQRMAPDDARLDPVYRACAEAAVPVVIHAGREPSNAAYGIDTHALCSAAALRRVLERHPKTTVVVPHLGADEQPLYFALLSEFEHLYLDTTMMLSGFLGPPPNPALLERHADRVLYGTDFPNIPYPWSTELDWLHRVLSPAAERQILSGNALLLFT